MGTDVTTWSRIVLEQRGQTTSEWLMIAGVFTALVVFMLGLVPRALGVFVRGVAIGVRTIAP